jgi:hypothetical protein
MMVVPEIVLTPREIEVLTRQWAGFGGRDLGQLERAVLASELPLSLEAVLCDLGLKQRASALWAAHDHFVLRGVPPSADGVTGLLLGAALFLELKPYRDGKVVKHFTMSPWTTALSHTLADGFFHTDINTAAHPPAATLMQCMTPDPDSPRHGQLRVVRLADLLSALRSVGHERALRLLTQDRVDMVNDTSPDRWSGQITDGSEIRFHPETLRAAQRRYSSNPPDLEECLAEIHSTALSIAPPIDLASGEMLVVSNRRALHQRNACTVRFRQFPREFESRSVSVLHAMGELGRARIENHPPAEV